MHKDHSVELSKRSKKMKKKQTLSKTELQEMTGLDFSEQNSQVEESQKEEY